MRSTPTQTFSALAELKTMTSDAATTNQPSPSTGGFPSQISKCLPKNAPHLEVRPTLRLQGEMDLTKLTHDRQFRVDDTTQLTNPRCSCNDVVSVAFRGSDGSRNSMILRFGIRCVVTCAALLLFSAVPV